MHCEHGLFFYNCTPRLTYKILHGYTENDSSLLLPFRPPLLDILLWGAAFELDACTSQRRVREWLWGRESSGQKCHEYRLQLMFSAYLTSTEIWESVAGPLASSLDSGCSNRPSNMFQHVTEVADESQPLTDDEKEILEKVCAPILTEPITTMWRVSVAHIAFFLSFESILAKKARSN